VLIRYQGVKFSDDDYDTWILYLCMLHLVITKNYRKLEGIKGTEGISMESLLSHSPYIDDV